MGDCHINFSPPLCKYSYASWCPTCERSSPRRRSRSETANECRKKCREMKTFSPRKHSRSQEYENMDLEYDVSPKEFRHVRSSQLCELPTSYISNNCQLSKLLPTADDFHLDEDKNNVKSLEKMRQEDFFDVDVVKYEKVKHFTNGFSRKLPKEPLKACTYDTHLSFDTRTYFDKIRDTAGLHDRYTKEIESVREKIAQWRTVNQQKVEQSLKFGQVSVNGPEKYCLRPNNGNGTREVDACLKEKLKDSKSIGAEKFSLNGNFSVINAFTDVPKPSKIVSLKTRVKSGSCSVKKRRVRTPANQPSSTASSFSESGSDESENEEIKSEDESESLSESNNCEQQVSLSESFLPQPGGGDNFGWPMRPSLFPHIPPYIRFTAHDSESPMVVPAGRKLFKWKLSTITPILVRKTLSNSGFALIRKSNQWLGTWGKHMKSPMFKTLKETQKLNHFPGTFQLGRKDRLWRNFQRLINKYGYKEFGFIPQTFVLPQEMKILKQNWEYKNRSGGETWIIKPPASARGVGIKVINKWSQLPKKQSLVVQKYISNPYLINGSKFDLRLYVLVTSFDPLRIYLYPDGLARFASVKYSDSAKDLKDRYMHLTNYSINKFSSQYTANEDANACQGHKWTITKLFEYMEGQGVDTKTLWNNLQQLVIKTIITGEAPIYQLCQDNMLSRYNCYELFGIDVLLDEHLKPWILEVNISPSLHSASPLDAHVKGPLVQMLFDLAQFHFPPRLGQRVKDSPQCYESKIYSTNLTKKEREKHNLFVQYECREDYLDDILENLTGDDVRKLTLAEDELTVKGTFERIFPTSQSFKYLNFMEPRYYNRLFDAWETKFEKDRQTGIGILRALCAEKVHLKVAPPSTLDKSSLNTTLGPASIQPSKEGQSRPVVEVTHEATITNSPSCNN